MKYYMKAIGQYLFTYAKPSYTILANQLCNQFSLQSLVLSTMKDKVSRQQWELVNCSLLDPPPPNQRGILCFLFVSGEISLHICLQTRALLSFPSGSGLLLHRRRGTSNCVEGHFPSSLQWSLLLSLVCTLGREIL